jgi:hypothetical protein
MKLKGISIFPVVIIILTSASWIASCTHDAKISDLPEICFEGDVLPIFLNSCAISGCHNGQGESDLILNNYAGIRHGVVPGSLNSSSIYKAITTTMGENKMPPDQPVSLENRTIIALWIQQGAKETLCPERIADYHLPNNK